MAVYSSVIYTVFLDIVLLFLVKKKKKKKEKANVMLSIK